MSIDYRRLWIKDRILTLVGLEAEEYFDDLMAANDGELDDKLEAFLDDDIFRTDEVDKKLFYVYRMPLERLVDEEILVAEIGK